MGLRIWVVDAFGAPGLSVQQSFGGLDLEIFHGSTKNEFVIPEPPPHLAIVTLSEQDPERDLAYVRRIHGAIDKLPIIGIAVNSSEDLAIAAFRSGCRDYLRHPYAAEELSAAIERCLDRSAVTSRGGGSISAAPPDGLDGVVGESLAIRTVRSYIGKVAATSSTVLITGETGTGKELVAELLHRTSAGAGRPFVAVNCAAIPDPLIESELFGYEKGAFTGAARSTAGKLQMAGDGTIFFDEIGDMSSYAQAKILRAIESREASRLGAHVTYPIRCRFIAATNCHLERNVIEGRFRKDLYYRLNVARIHVPALRDRRSDIPVLCSHFIAGFNRQRGREVDGCNADVMDSLLQYDWPGNVRELRNLLEAAYLNQPGHSIEYSDLPEWFSTAIGAEAPAFERGRVMEALLRSNWNKSKAAEALHLSRMTLYRRIAKYGIDPRPAPRITAPSGAIGAE